MSPEAINVITSLPVTPLMLQCVTGRQLQCCDFLVMEKVIKAIKWVIKAAQSEVLTDAITQKQHWYCHRDVKCPYQQRLLAAGCPRCFSSMSPPPCHLSRPR